MIGHYTHDYPKNKPEYYPKILDSICKCGHASIDHNMEITHGVMLPNDILHIEQCAKCECKKFKEDKQTTLTQDGKT